MFFICFGTLLHEFLEIQVIVGQKQNLTFSFLEDRLIERCRAWYRDSLILDRLIGIKTY